MISAAKWDNLLLGGVFYLLYFRICDKIKI